jgi:predicted PurR-regulated permease PerM
VRDLPRPDELTVRIGEEHVLDANRGAYHMTPSSAPDASPAPEPAQPIGVRNGRLLTTLLMVLAAAGCLWLVWLLLAPASHVLVLVVLAMVLALILAPVVRWLARRVRRRGLAVAAALLLFLVILVVVILILLGPLIQQLAALAGQLPAIAQAIQRYIRDFEDILIAQGLSPAWVLQQEQQVVERVNQLGAQVLSGLLGAATGLVGSIFDFLIVLTFTGYLLADGPRFRDNIMRLIPARWRPGTCFAQEAITTSVGGYILGQLTVGLFVGTMAGLGCWLIGVPYPLVIALLAGLLELIPVVGPYLSAVPALLIALPLGVPTILWVLALFVLIQQVELNVLGPRITGHAVGLHPFVALVVILTGANYGGLIGAVAAVPLAATAYVLAARAYLAWQAQRGPVVLPERLAQLEERARQALAEFESAEQRGRKTAPAPPTSGPEQTATPNT